MYDNILTAIDIGTDSVKILVAEKRDDFLHFEVLGFVQVPCFGVIKGVVVDVNEVTKSIKNGLEQLKKVYSEEINSVYINIGGKQLSVIHSDGTIMVSMANKNILKKDVERALDSTVPFSIKNEKEILGIFPKEYIVDDKEVYDLENIKGRKIKVKTIILTALTSNLEKLKRSVFQAGLKVDKVVPCFIADTAMVLDEKQKEKGVALVYIGASSSSVSIFKNNKLQNFTILPFGSSNITNDIAIKLNCKTKTAERIKKEIELLLETERTNKKKVELIQGKNEWEENLIFSPKEIYNNVILLRVDEILEEIKLEIDQTIKKELLPAGVIMVGGGVKLFDIINIAKKKIGLNAEIGLPKLFNLIGENSEMVTICGLNLIRYKEKNFQRGKISIKIIENNVKKTINNIIKKIKNLKQ